MEVAPGVAAPLELLATAYHRTGDLPSLVAVRRQVGAHGGHEGVKGMLCGDVSSVATGLEAPLARGVRKSGNMCASW